MSALAPFAAALTVPDAPIPAGVVAPDGSPSRRRFAVYRNNTASTLIEALGDNFPLCRALVGERFFDAVAAEHMRLHPPRSPILFRYGGTFPDFAAGFPPAAGVPYLADLARLEWAWLEAHHEADAPALRADALAAFAPEDLACIRVTPHPALRTVRSRFPIVSVAARLRADEDLAGLDMGGGEDALVTRPELEVGMHALPPGARDFIEALRTAPLGAAADAASRVEGFDLSGNIAALFGVGGVTRLELEA